jgi:hypothetical protein
VDSERREHEGWTLDRVRGAWRGKACAGVRRGCDSPPVRRRPTISELRRRPHRDEGCAGWVLCHLPGSHSRGRRTTANLPGAPEDCSTRGATSSLAWPGTAGGAPTRSGVPRLGAEPAPGRVDPRLEPGRGGAGAAAETASGRDGAGRQAGLGEGRALMAVGRLPDADRLP